MQVDELQARRRAALLFVRPAMHDYPGLNKTEMRSPGIALWGCKPGSAPGPLISQQRAPSAHWPAGRGATVAGSRRGGEGARVGLGSTWEARHGWAAQIGRPIRWRPGGCPAEPAETGDWDVRAASNKTCGGGSRAEPTERATGTAHLRAPCHGRLRGARLQDARDPTRPAACPRRARDLPAAAQRAPAAARPGCAAGRSGGPPSAWVRAGCVCCPWAGLARQPGVLLVAIQLPYSC